MVRHEGWNYLTRVDHRMDPLYRRTEFNSENFNWMSRMAGVFWSHEFDDRENQRYFDAYLDNLVRALYAAGRVEWNSSVYWGYTFQAALVLYESAHDTKVKEQARAILDWMTVEAALHYFNGSQVGPDVRAKTEAYRAFAGSVWPYAYLYFTDGEHPAPYSDVEAAAHLSVEEAGYVPYASYRPPRAAIEIAQRKFQMPVEIQSAKPYYGLDEDNYADWNGQRGVRRRFDFETLYLDKDFTLASAATLRPDGGCEKGWPDAVRGAEPVAAGGEGRATLRQRGSQRHDVGTVSVRGNGTVRERDDAHGEGNGPDVGSGPAPDEGGNHGQGDAGTVGGWVGGEVYGSGAAERRGATATYPVERLGLRTVHMDVRTRGSGGPGAGSGTWRWEIAC